MGNKAVQCGRRIFNRRPITPTLGGPGLMFFDSSVRPIRAANRISALAVGLALTMFSLAAPAQEPDISKKLDGFDSYMEQTLKDWNTPGIGVGIVVNNKLVFAKGYGYRDYEKKLPFTP